MLAIRADRLFDGVDADAVERPVVLVDRGRIAAVLAGVDIIEHGSFLTAVFRAGVRVR